MDQSFLKKMVWENDFQSLQECIYRTIDKIETILLWQPESDIVKKKHEAFIQKFASEKGVLQLVEVNQQKFNFREDEDVYIRFSDRSLLFKAHIRKMSHDKIQIIVPRKFRIIENREQARSNLLEQDIKVKVDLDVQYKTKNSSFEMNVLDLSQDGIGVVFSVTKINYFKVGQKIFISKFGDVPLDERVICEIVHVTKTERNMELITSRDYKMGLRFLSAIPYFMNSYEE
ncbi:PilZ domain-containing protein [Halobacteriovorax sp.]|uniref:PilZ domain-containing protein n=1 Tax=Halobacteriovorax sp. TaxID=2020862 RepID=UPI00356311F3